MVCKLFHPPILNMDRSITIFGSILAFIKKFFTNLHSSRRSEPILHSSRSSGSFSTFSNFSHPSGASDQFSHLSRSHFIHFSWNLHHLLLDTNPTCLRCNDSFIHPSRRTHPTQKFVRRHLHDRTFAQIRTAADFVSHHSEDIPEQQVGRKTLMHSEILAQIVLSSLNCQIVLHLLPLIFFCQRGCLFSSCWLSMTSPPDASTCRTAICSSSLFPGSKSTYPAPRSTRTLLLSFTRSVSAILSLYAFILASPVKDSLNDRSDRFWCSSLCDFVALSCDATVAQSTSSESMSFNFRSRPILQRSFIHNPWWWGSLLLLVNCDLLRQLQFWSLHLPRSVTQTFPSSRFPSITQCLSCPTFASYNSILENA